MEFLRRFWSSDRSLTALLLLLVVLIFVVDPLGDLGIGGRVLIDVVFSLLLISGVGAAARGVFPTVAVSVLLLATLALRWLRWSSGAEWLAAPNAFSSALLCAILAAVVLAQVFREGPITAQRLQGAVAVYLLFGLAWAFTYTFIALRWPDAFASSAVATNPKSDLSSRFVYFSFVTLTTTGYGDITAVHPMARSLVMAEALVGQLFPAILLARLVSMEVYYRQAQHTERR
jgi:ion channel